MWLYVDGSNDPFSPSFLSRDFYRITRTHAHERVRIAWQIIGSLEVFADGNSRLKSMLDREEFSQFLFFLPSPKLCRDPSNFFPGFLDIRIDGRSPRVEESVSSREFNRKRVTAGHEREEGERGGQRPSPRFSKATVRSMFFRFTLVDSESNRAHGSSEASLFLGAIARNWW